METKVLLDTHVALWLFLDSKNLPKKIRKNIESKDTSWFFHQVSLWEIQIKYDLHKLKLPERPEKIFPKVIEESGLNIAIIENEAIFMLGKLPKIHRDLFDRLLIAHAMKNNWQIATEDKIFDSYPVMLYN